MLKRRRGGKSLPPVPVRRRSIDNVRRRRGSIEDERRRRGVGIGRTASTCSAGSGDRTRNCSSSLAEEDVLRGRRRGVLRESQLDSFECSVRTERLRLV